jgi:hypothetical protein
MHSTRGHRDSPREGLIDRGKYSRRSGGCLEGEGEGGETLSLIIDEVKTGEIHGLARGSYIPLRS